MESFPSPSTTGGEQPQLFAEPVTPTEDLGHTYQPPLPLPPGVVRHGKGELFPGRAGGQAAEVGEEPAGLLPAAEPVEEFKRFSASKLASRDALREAGITEFKVKELPTAFTGLRLWMAGRSVKRAEKELTTTKELMNSHSSWGSAALRGKMYKDKRPVGVREDYRSRKKGKIAAHRSVNVAEKTSLEYMDGYAQIDPETGKSKRRDKDGSLDHLGYKLRRDIKKAEKSWDKLKHKIHHEEDEILHGSRRKMKVLKKQSNQKVRKAAEEKVAAKRKKLHKLEVAHSLKPVRSSARAAYRTEIAKAWRRETNRSLGHRNRFYEDLAERMKPGTPVEDERMTVRPNESLVEGGLIERVARRRTSRQKNLMDHHGKSNNGQAAHRRKKILEQRAEKYKKHESTTRRRRANGRKLADIRVKRNERYQKLREAKRKLHDLETPHP